MAKKVLFVFAGTGDKASNIHANYENQSFDEDVIRVYFNGCQDPNIGGKQIGLGYVAPNLDVVSEKLRSCFTSEGELSFKDLQRKFKGSVQIEGMEGDDKQISVKVETITLSGFSRGAVTTFAAARHLDDLNIPMALIAEDPVPGNDREQACKISSEYYKNQDLTGLKNLKTAQVFLGTYTKQNGIMQNKFFRQMAPEFATDTNADVFLLPKRHHLSYDRRNDLHLSRFLQNRGLVSSIQEKKILNSEIHFIPREMQQKFHQGVSGRARVSPLYLTSLKSQLKDAGYRGRSSLSVKTAQTLLALAQTAKSKQRTVLEKKVQQDNTATGKAVRDFIVEFENTLYHSLKDREDEAFTTELTNVRQGVYAILADFPTHNAEPKQVQDMQNQVLYKLNALRPHVSKNEFALLRGLMERYMNHAPLFHERLCQYLDESEKLGGKRDIHSAPVVVETVAEVASVDDLTNVLFYMSPRQRTAEFSKYSAKIPEIVTNSAELGEILRFVIPKDIKTVLSSLKIQECIKTPEDVINLAAKSSTAAQRKTIFKALYPQMSRMTYTEQQKSIIGQLVPETKTKISDTQVLKMVNSQLKIKKQLFEAKNQMHTLVEPDQKVTPKM